jgi:AcrR family transcriptional regulator
MNERSFSAAMQGPDTASSIFDSAVTVFSERGFHGASMRQLAEDAGVSLGNIYNYFGSKSEILLGILRSASARQMAETDAAIEAAGPDVIDRFRAGVAAFARYDVENLDVAFIANSELRSLEPEHRREIVGQRDRQQKVFADLIAEGLETGAFRTPHPSEAALAILTMCAGITVWYRPDGGLDADEVAQRYARFALAVVEAL